MDDARLLKLKKLFEGVINGRTALTGRNSLQFLESIYSQPQAATCVDKVISGSSGLKCVQEAMRMDLTPNFYNGAAAKLLGYLQAPELVTISNGTFLREMILAIVEPPIFWNRFFKAFREGELNEDATRCLAWLLSNLVSLPGDAALPYTALAEEKDVLNALITSSSPDIRALGQKIKNVVETRGQGQVVEEMGPGGRHDNDFPDFRRIAILPTADEMSSKEASFLRFSADLDDPKNIETRQATYLDNQFRMLREDMLYEMKEELPIALGMKRRRSRNPVLTGFKLYSAHYEPVNTSQVDRGGTRWGIVLESLYDLPQFHGLPKDDGKKRKAFLLDNRNVLRHEAMMCLLVDGEVIAFPRLIRDEDLLVLPKARLVLRLDGEASAINALLRFKSHHKEIKLIQIDTPIFAFEPVLKALQEMKLIPLAEELLFWKDGDNLAETTVQPTRLVRALEHNPGLDLQPFLDTPKSIKLDQSQVASFVLGLTQRVSLIQGPPGTGKSFIGALLAKAIHDLGSTTILVVCYTNHALDQFLEDLMDIGIPESSMIRLGEKSTQKTANLSLRAVRTRAQNAKLTRGDWAEIDSLRAAVQDLKVKLGSLAAAYTGSGANYREVMDHLEFEADEYWEAFTVPTSGDGMKLVGRQGRKIDEFYLLNQWCNGWDAGVFKKNPVVIQAADIWAMPHQARMSEYRKWMDEILREKAARIYETARTFNESQVQLESKFNEGTRVILREKRIIACTTTAAAKYREHIAAASPDVLLVEEAGEILESHVLTALSRTIKQLILIGDHKQLRPKVNNYLLTVEKGEGYDLNRSLFERLVLKGYPHETLTQQHRMRPEISTLVRHLTYPELKDADKTKNRDNLRGVQNNIVFINHAHPEGDHDELAHRSNDEIGSKGSKKNEHEVKMVLKIVRYLGQQGYGTDRLVILTPYLGQLRALQLALRTDNDPVLNDLDSADLVRAGLVSAGAAKVSKGKLRIATIDNYQGEESDIVVISLTRSNANGTIGFMSSPQRVNVLLSRARNALIMIGNSDTFLKSRAGQEVWGKLLDILKRNGNIYDGLPVMCERHPDRTALLKDADDFDQNSPDGGCTEPCRAILRCQVHSCPSKCHQISDHSKMPCEHIMRTACAKGHQQEWKCRAGAPAGCAKCDREAKREAKRLQDEFDLQQKRDRDQRLHAEKMAEAETKISEQRVRLRDAQLAGERDAALKQKQQDLEDAIAMAANASASATARIPPTEVQYNSPSTPQVPLNQASQPAQPTQPQSSTAIPTKSTSSKPLPSSPPPAVRSEAASEWQRQKDIDGEANKAIDSIMEMTGLESVKAQVLNIKAVVDTAKRQGTSLTDQRFNVCMLGNPGTGKTTVARLYAKFLASVQVIPGTSFMETTGSGLANDGVPGVKKLIEDLVKNGGGTIFVDEAYQLTSGQNSMGGQVLDFLLAEMENRVGTIVFIFAGYNKEMEKFFEHNPGLKSRVPYDLQFKDYTDAELVAMLEDLLKKKFPKGMKVEDGIRGLYGRIAIRRMGRGRGKPGFGNARALQNLFAVIHGRQSKRLTEERRQGLQPDDFLLTKEDLVGPDPSKVVLESEALKKLGKLIGLQSVKGSIANLCGTLNTNYQRELLEKEPHQVSLNRVFLGNPGTGKTTVAKLYGQILADLGMLSNGEVVVKNPSDFVGAHLGESERQTKAILATTVGKVLIIDEAYSLYAGDKSTRDPYKTAVIDTIVAEVQSVPGEDRCVLMLGYKDQMETMFQNVNPGLSRRFAIEDAFHFQDYDETELRQALQFKLESQDLSATDAAQDVTMDVLNRLRNRPNFGNIGEVENLLSQAKTRYQARQATLPIEQRSPDAPFESQDFDPNFQRGNSAVDNLHQLFADVVGCDKVVELLAGYQRMAQRMKTLGRDPRDQIPTSFIFKGPPGTGKTTTARKMGQVYFDMGFLSSTEVIECSASDLVGEYVGQTGPKTRKLFEKALGKVLFVDEAYRLGEGHFAKEAMDELVGILTHEQFRGKLIVILAGYDQEMNALLRVNPGLASRFPDEILFTNISPSQCLEILDKELKKETVVVIGDLAAERQNMLDLLTELSTLSGWGNARDLKTLSKQVVRFAYRKADDSVSNELSVTPRELCICLHSMLEDRKQREADLPSLSARRHSLPQALPPSLQGPAPPSFKTAHHAKRSQNDSQPIQNTTNEDIDNRDPGVPDEIWQQLQADRQAMDEAASQAEKFLKAAQMEKILAATAEREAAAQKQLLEQKLKEAATNAEREALMRKREEARIQELKAREEHARLVAIAEAKRLEEENRRKKEAQAQTKLRSMGVCPVGFKWIKQASGYRCAGGSHFVNNADIGI